MSTNADSWVYRMTSYNDGEFADLHIFVSPQSRRSPLTCWGPTPADHANRWPGDLNRALWANYEARRQSTLTGGLTIDVRQNPVQLASRYVPPPEFSALELSGSDR
jgi:hypothetical protein